jgi:hypothetical protein
MHRWRDLSPPRGSTSRTSSNCSGNGQITIDAAILIDLRTCDTREGATVANLVRPPSGSPDRIGPRRRHPETYRLHSPPTKVLERPDKAAHAIGLRLSRNYAKLGSDPSNETCFRSVVFARLALLPIGVKVVPRRKAPVDGKSFEKRSKPIPIHRLSQTGRNRSRIRLGHVRASNCQNESPHLTVDNWLSKICSIKSVTCRLYPAKQASIPSPRSNMEPRGPLLEFHPEGSNT